MKSPLKFTSLPERSRLLVLSLAVGVLSGLAAVALTMSIDAVKELAGKLFPGSGYKWQYLVLPGIGMFVSLILVRYVIRDNIGHGVTKVLVAISRNESRIKPHNTWSSMVTSAVTIGLGGSVGAEAPIVYTGAAIGSNLGRLGGLSYRNITLLLGCGAAGAVAGIFKAPLAGVLFTMEILLFNMSMSSLFPLLLSTISATVVSYIFRGQAPVFACSFTEFAMASLPFYVVMGVVLGFCALYFTGTTLWLEDKLAGFRNPYLKWLVCAAGLGMLIFLFPPLFGEGYDSLTLLLNGGDFNSVSSTPLSFLFGSAWGVPFFFLMVFLLKIVAMTFTNAGGGNGGTFGPTLFAGAIMGFAIARTFNLFGAAVPEQHFVLVGMAGLMAAVMQAPMTAIFLIAEISGGYGLLIPLILTSTISYGTVRIFERYSIYTKRIAQSGDLLTHDNDKSVMTLMNVRSLIRDKYPRVQPEMTLRQVAAIVSGTTAAVLAVVDSDDVYQGLVDVGNIRKYLLEKSSYDSLKVYNLMEATPTIIDVSDKMESVMDKFDKTGAWRLPVVDFRGRYLGFISRSRLLMAYRDELKEISQD